MRRSWFSEEQIIGILPEQEAGMKVADVGRKHGITDATFYTWKTKCCGPGGERGAPAEITGGGEPAAEEASGGGGAGHAALKDLLGENG